ncbi:unnamed protein product [Paramecium primaurelia]|uniref:Uncharacterized protein n=1 Tax=Paramecium primaurelia TaxID=5886 RepID=A0A8S1LXA3_PARPR|nr:unnamed protein product [Paramecium primaurelia]
MSWASSKQQQPLDGASSIDENRESQNNLYFGFSVWDDQKVEYGQISQDQSSLNHPTKNQSKQTLCLYDDDGSILKKQSFDIEAIHKNFKVGSHLLTCSSPYMNEGDSQSNQDKFIIIDDQISQTPIIIEYISNPNPIIPTSSQADQQFYPKTTKNYYKCIHGALQKFMKDIQDNIQFTCKAKKFLESNPKVSGKLKLIRSIKSCQQMRSIAMKFLLDFQWCRYLVKNNKVDIERYFRLNQMLIQQIQE